MRSIFGVGGDALDRVESGLHRKPWVFRCKDLRAWWSNPHYDRPGGVERATPKAWVPKSKPIRFIELGCPAVDRGTNQPNVFLRPEELRELRALLLARLAR